MSLDQLTDRSIVFKNNTALFTWLFMVAWMATVAYFTNVALASDAPAYAMFFIALFWVVGVAISGFALWAPCVRVEISSSGVLVRERAILWRRDRNFSPKELSVSDIAESDGEDGTYYECSLLLPNRETIVLAHSRSRSKAAEVRVRLISALMTAERRSSVAPKRGCFPDDL